MAELGADGGDAVSAVLAEFMATQASAKAESELRACTASLNSVSEQLQEREEECAVLGLWGEYAPQGSTACTRALGHADD